jgi:hypothetical protein
LSSEWDDQNAGVIAQYFVRAIFFSAYDEAFWYMGYDIDTFAKQHQLGSRSTCGSELAAIFIAVYIAELLAEKSMKTIWNHANSAIRAKSELLNSPQLE